MNGRLHARTLARLGASYGDDALGEWLALEVRRALARGGAPPVALAVRSDRVDVFDLKEAYGLGMAPGAFVALLSTATVSGETEPPEAVGVMGTGRARNAGSDVPAALVFLEWSDCRWWQWGGLLEPDGRSIRPGTDAARRATDGDPRPGGLGGWWSFGRRARMSAHLERVGAPPATPAVVH